MPSDLNLYSFIAEQWGCFILIMVRISGIFTSAPVFGSRNVPIYAKLGLAFIFSYILFPMVYQEGMRVPTNILAYFFLVALEFMVGLILGFVASFVFSAIQMAGQLLDMQVGFGIVNVIDPQFGQQIPLIGNLKYIIATIFFLSTNGHHIFLTALFESFRQIALMHVMFQPELPEVIIALVFKLFVIALKISLPVLVALLLSDVALGILARTMPQMNIFIVGIPAKIGIGLFVIFLALPFYLSFLEVAFNDMYRDIYRMLSYMH